MISRWFRSCASCSGCVGPIDLFCESCWQRLFIQMNFRETHEVSSHFLTSSLWRWDSNTHLVDCFVRSQKRCALQEARERIVRQYLAFLPRELPESLCCVVSSLNPKDHGLEWTKAFSTALGRPYFSLSITDQSHHKLKGRKQRYEERQVRAPGKDLWAGKTCWFIDDVVTTGATSKAVWLSLGKPKDFRTVALVYRALPCTSA